MGTSNKERGDLFAALVGKYLAQQKYVLSSEYAVNVGLNSKSKKMHRFDHGNGEMLVECKFFDRTESGNAPSAKISTLNEAMMYFHSAPSSYRKLLFLPKTEKSGIRISETFAEYYVRLHMHFIPDQVEIWELHEMNLQARRVA